MVKVDLEKAVGLYDFRINLKETLTC